MLKVSIIIVEWEIFRWHAYLSQCHVDLHWWFTLCSFAAFCLPSLPSQPLLGPFTVLCSVEFSFFILSRDQCHRFRWEVGWLTVRTVVMVVLLICILRTFTCLSQLAPTPLINIANRQVKLSPSWATAPSWVTFHKTKFYFTQGYVTEGIPATQRYLQTSLKLQIELISVYRHIILLSGMPASAHAPNCGHRLFRYKSF